MSSDLAIIIEHLRRNAAGQLERGERLGDVGRLIADAEEELDRHAQVVSALVRRSEDLARGTILGHKRTQALFDRPRPAGLDSRAARPKPVDLTDDQIDRHVVIAYETANPTFYRSVIDRLEPGELVRNVTKKHRWYEYTRDDFERLLPGIAASPSYLTGTGSAPGKARYVTGRPPAAMGKMLAPDSPIR